MEDARIRRWHRISELAIDADELRELRAAVVSVCAAPRDPIVRQHLRTLTESRAMHDQAVPLLSVEARTQDDPVVLAALRDEARYLCEHVYRPVERLSVLEEMATREPDNPVCLERLAWTYYLVGAWVQAAQTLELLAPHVTADQALVVLRAAGRLFRNSGRNDRALVAYRAVALRKPSDLDALMALADLMVSPTGAPDSRFDPQTSPATAARRAKAPVPQASPPSSGIPLVDDRPPRETRPVGSGTKSRVSPVDPIPAEHSDPVILTTKQAAAAAHDLFASLEEDEIEGSLAFAFGAHDDPFRELAKAPQPEAPPKKSSRQTQERDGLLRPPAQRIPSLVAPSVPVVPIELPPETHTVIDLDEIIDAPRTGQHAVPDLAALGLAENHGPALRALAIAAEQRGDHERAIDVLEKLLAAQRAGGEVRERAETCELLARLVTDDQRRRTLAEEAIAAYETTGDSDRADELAIWAHRPVREPRTP